MAGRWWAAIGFMKTNVSNRVNKVETKFSLKNETENKRTLKGLVNLQKTF